MLTRFRIMRGDTEVYRGKRSAVVRKLATLSKRENVSKLRVEVSTSTKMPDHGGAEVWTPAGNGTEFLAS